MARVAATGEPVAAGASGVGDAVAGAERPSVAVGVGSATRASSDRNQSSRSSTNTRSTPPTTTTATIRTATGQELSFGRAM